MYLFIDTSSFFINLCFIKNNKILDEISEKVEKDMSNKIISLIRKISIDNNINIKDIKKIFVTIGPGSFTGVRIGLTVGKIIAMSLNIPIVPISTLEYLACIDTEYKKIVPLIDARRGNVFTAVYDNNLNLISKEQLIDFSKVIVDNDSILVSYDGFNSTDIIKPNIIKLINKHVDDECPNLDILAPNYLKKTEAEENLYDQKNN